MRGLDLELMRLAPGPMLDRERVAWPLRPAIDLAIRLLACQQSVMMVGLGRERGFETSAHFGKKLHVVRKFQYGA